MVTTLITRLSNASIWWFAFGYFASYVPYSALAKAISSGRYPGLGTPTPGARLLFFSLLTTTCMMLVFLWFTGLIRYAHKYKIGSISIPYPSFGPLLSGLCTSAIIATTTLAYTFSGISIVFVMLLMRGGVLMLAPIVDSVSKRKTNWYSWVGLGLSLLALIVAFAEKGRAQLTLIASIDIGVYLAAYFVRLRLMSRFAKSDDPDKQWRFFAEEQLVAAPVALFAVIFVGLTFDTAFAKQVALGFSPSNLGIAFVGVLVLGLFSQSTGIFGGLILLNKQENTFCVPVNRSSSILAGVVASLTLSLWLGVRSPSTYQYAGASIIIGAILVLSLPPLLKKRKEKQESLKNSSV